MSGLGFGGLLPASLGYGESFEGIWRKNDRHCQTNELGQLRFSYILFMTKSV